MEKEVIEMAKWWAVRRYGKYVTDAIYNNAKEALEMYDKACKHEVNYARKFDTSERPIALFKYDPSARFNRKINSSETMLYYSQKPLPKWPGVRYRNVKDAKKKQSRTNDFGLNWNLR